MERNKLSWEQYAAWRNSLLRNIQTGNKGVKMEQNKIPISDRNEFKKWDELYDDEDAKNEVRKVVQRRVTILEGQQVKGAESDLKETVTSEHQHETSKRSTYSNEDLELIKDVERKLQSERIQCHKETSVKKEQLFDAYVNNSSPNHTDSAKTSFRLYNSFQQMMNSINHPLYYSVPSLQGNVNTQRHVNYKETNIFMSNPLGQLKNHSWVNDALQHAYENIGMTLNQYSDMLKNLGNTDQMNVNALPVLKDTVRSSTRPSSTTDIIQQNNEQQGYQDLDVDEECIERETKSEYTQDNTVTTPMDISSEEEELDMPCSRKRTWSDFYSDILPAKKKLQTTVALDKKLEKAVKTDKPTSLLKENSHGKVKTDSSSSDQELHRKRTDSSDKKWLPESLSFVPCDGSSKESPPETPISHGDRIAIKIKKCRQDAETQEKMLLKTSNMHIASGLNRKTNGKFNDVSRVLEFGKLKNAFGAKRKSQRFDEENISKEIEQFFERPGESSEPEDQTTVEEPEENPVRKIVIVQSRNSDSQKKNGLNENQDSVSINDTRSILNGETIIQSDPHDKSVNATQKCNPAIEWKTKFQCSTKKDSPEVSSVPSLNTSLDKVKSIFNGKRSPESAKTEGKKAIVSSEPSLNTSLDKVKSVSNPKRSPESDKTDGKKAIHKQRPESDRTEKIKRINDVKSAKSNVEEKDTVSNTKQKGKCVVRDLTSLETFGQIFSQINSKSSRIKSKSDVDAGVAKWKNTAKAKIDLLRKLESSEPNSKKNRKGKESPEAESKPALKDKESIPDKSSVTKKQSVKSTSARCPVSGCPGSGDISLKEHAFREHIPSIFKDNDTDTNEMKVFKCRKRFNILREIAGSVVKESASLDGLVRFFNQGKRLPPIDLSDSIDVIRECCIHHGWKIPGTFKANPINSISVLMNWHVLLYCVKHMTIKQRIVFKNMCNNAEGKESKQRCLETKSNDADAKKNPERKTGNSTADLKNKVKVSETTETTGTTMKPKSSIKNKPATFGKKLVNQSVCIVLSSDDEESNMTQSGLKRGVKGKKLSRKEEQVIKAKPNENNGDVENSKDACNSGKSTVSNRIESEESCSHGNKDVSKAVSGCNSNKFNDQENTRTNVNDDQIQSQSSKTGNDDKQNSFKMYGIKNSGIPENQNECLEQKPDTLNATSCVENDDNEMSRHELQEQVKEPTNKMSDALIIYVCPCGKMAKDHDLVFDHLIDHGCKGTIDIIDIAKDKVALPLLINQDGEDIEMYETDEDDYQVSENSDDEQMKENADYIAELTALIDDNDCSSASNISDCGGRFSKQNTDCHTAFCASVEENPKSAEALKGEETGCDVQVNGTATFAGKNNINTALTSNEQDKLVQNIDAKIDLSSNGAIESKAHNAQNYVKETSENNDGHLADKTGQSYSVKQPNKSKSSPPLSKDDHSFSAKSKSVYKCKRNQSDKELKNRGQKSNVEIKHHLPQSGQFFSSNHLMSRNKEGGHSNFQKRITNDIDPKISIVWKDGSSCPVLNCDGSKECFNNFTSFDNHWKFYHIPFQVFKRCSVCGEQSTRKYNMKKHVKEEHYGKATLLTKVLPNHFYIDPGAVEKYVHDREWLHK